MVYFKLPVGALVIYDPSFEIFDRVNACTLEDLFAFGSDPLDGGERCGLEEFEVFAYSLQCSCIVGCVVLSKGTSKNMSVHIT